MTNIELKNGYTQAPLDVVRKYSFLSNVAPVRGGKFTDRQKALIAADKLTHYAVLATGNKCLSKVPKYFINECNSHGFTVIVKIGGTTGKFIMLGLRK